MSRYDAQPMRLIEARSPGAGMSLKECAKYLHISTSAASTYRARLMEKLNLQSTPQVIRFALENDVVS